MNLPKHIILNPMSRPRDRILYGFSDKCGEREREREREAPIQQLPGINVGIVEPGSYSASSPPPPDFHILLGEKRDNNHQGQATNYPTITTPLDVGFIVR